MTRQQASARLASAFVPALALTLHLVAAPAGACGGVYSHTTTTTAAGSVVNSNRSMMAIIPGPDRTTVWTAVQVTGDATQFAWVMPTPKPPDSVHLAHKHFFSWLDAMTAPRVTVITETTTIGGGGGGRSGCGCLFTMGAASRGGSSGSKEADGQHVTVHANGEAGPFELPTGSADSAE